METNFKEVKQEDPTDLIKIIRLLEHIINIAQNTHDRTRFSLDNIKRLETVALNRDTYCIDISSSVVSTLYSIVTELTDINDANIELTEHLESIV